MADVTFTSWGSADCIGPSCHVFRFGEFHVAVDYGAGIRDGADQPVYDGTLDALIVTHAHRDHVGLLPRALTKWPKARCWATFETASLARWIWDDELNIARVEHRPFPFSYEQVETASRKLKRIIPGRWLALSDEVMVKPFAAGHILGAVGLIFQYGGEHYVVTGDIGLRDHGFIPGAQVPYHLRTRLLVRESTYAGQLTTSSREERSLQLLARIDEVLRSGGRVLIPTLSIDRMPEIYDLLFRAGLHHRWPLWVIGGARPTQIYLDYAPGAWSLRTMQRFVNHQHQDDVRKSGEPAVIIASSGMVAKNSPSYTWAIDILDDPDSAILMVNWQDPCTPGGIILNGSPDEPLQLPTGAYRRRCVVERFDFSSHAKEDEMQEIEERLNPDDVIHVHGESARIDEFLGSEAAASRRRHKATIGREFAF